MRIYSIMPQIGATNLRKRNQVISNNQTMPVNINMNRVYNTSGILLTFTGNEKNINQFASYAPENKRYGVRAYNLGGLGVVAQEAPASWRIKEGADVRDFSPYHSFNNTDGGVTVVRLTKNKNGEYDKIYPAKNFIKAKQDESLEDIAKRIQLKKSLLNIS